MPSINKKDMYDNNSNESVQNIEKSELDGIIKDVKIQIRKLFGGYKEQLERIGNVLKTKRVIKEEDICTEIKNALREEIKEKIISSDTIERCCPDEWKRKTKPKDIRDPQLRISEDKNPLEQETVTNTNTNITSGGQILQQEFEPDHSKIVKEKVKEKEKESFENDRQEQKQIIKEQEEELKRLRPLAEVAKEQESKEIQQLRAENEQQKEEIQSLREKLDKLKEGGEEVWTAIAILELRGNQVRLKITVNTKQKKIEHVEIDTEKIKQASVGESEETTRITPSQNLEELQAKVDRMPDNIINLSKIEKQEDRAFKQQFLEIIEGAKRLKIDKNELLRMFHERLQGRGPEAATVESHVRRVLSSNWNRVCSSN